MLQHNIPDTKSLGYILQTGKAFCRHRCGLLYLIGKYNGLDVDIQYSKLDADNSRHSFLLYRDEKNEFIIDPMLNLYGQREKIVKQLQNTGRPIMHHTNTSTMQIEFEF